MSEIRKGQLTLFHHADVNAAFETTGLAVTPVVFGDGAASAEWAGEGGFTLHAASTGVQNDQLFRISDSLSWRIHVVEMRVVALCIMLGKHLRSNKNIFY